MEKVKWEIAQKFETYQWVFPDPSPFNSEPKYTFLAEYLQDSSIGQDRQFVASPAAVGLRVLLNSWREPAELTVVGICAGWMDPGGGEHKSHNNTSMSWHDLVSSVGAVVDSFRQFPLLGIST